MSAKSSAARYGSVAITIHWLSALLILCLLATGLLAAGVADQTAKLALVRAHIPMGIGILLLTLLRIVWWWLDRRRPELPANEPAWQGLTAKAVHLGLYAVMLTSAASGIATIVLSGALPAVLNGTAFPDWNNVPPHLAHFLSARLMLGLLGLHIGAALYHQFVRHDHLLARMGFGGPVASASDG